MCFSFMELRVFSIHSSVGKNGVVWEIFMISLYEKPNKSRTATLPAKVSWIPFVSWNFCEPIKKKSPFWFLWVSTYILMYVNNSGAYWISSMIKGMGLFWMNIVLFPLFYLLKFFQSCFIRPLWNMIPY